MTGQDLIGVRTREAVRDQMSGTVLREIDEMWMDELFAPPPGDDPEVPGQGQRVARFQAYLDVVDWTEPSHVARALRVFEVGLRHLWEHPWNPTWDASPTIERLRRLFERDGYSLTDDGKIVGAPVAIIAEGALAGLSDSSAILDHLDRIARAVEHDDPAQAIGSAKELIESTAKLILAERDETLTGKEDLPELTRRAQIALKVHPANAPQGSGPDGSDAVKRILGAASTVTLGVAELRNRGYGTGHGSGAPRIGLSARHANLAINAAKLWCQFMLDTLADSRAPWRQTPDIQNGDHLGVNPPLRPGS